MAPRLTFFVELSGDALVELFATPGVLDFLIRHRCTIAMGLLDLTPARAEVVRRLEGSGVAVTAWLLLDIAEGYWLNADNAPAARRRLHDTLEWGARERLTLPRVGLDIEFPRADGDLLMHAPRRGFWTLLRRRRAAAEVDAAERVYAALVEEIRAAGRSVETYHFPHLLDERRVDTTLLRRTLGLVDVAADAEVFMLYASFLGTAGGRVYFPEARRIAVGVSGGGVDADSPAMRRRFLSWPQLAQELLAAAVVTDEVYVFSLEGCVEHGMLESLAALDWGRAPDPLDPRALRAAARARRQLQWLLRAEPVFDQVLPSRRRS
jgi:hypothetical protein